MAEMIVKGENVGPLDSVSFALERPGVTVLYAPNGAGKSVLVKAVQDAMAGSGKVPLKDHAVSGNLEAFGVTVRFGARTRHGGQLQVLSLNSKVDLATLVDPKIKDPIAADKSRMKQLILMGGEKVTDRPFRESGMFPEYDDVTSPDVLESSDFVEMADRIKRSYESASRKAAEQAQKHSIEAQNCQSVIDAADLLAEDNEQVLLEAYNGARDAVTGLRARHSMLSDQVARRQDATTRLEKLRSDYKGPTAADATLALTEASQRRQAAQDEVARITTALRLAEAEVNKAEQKEMLAEKDLRNAKQYEQGVATCEAALKHGDAEDPASLAFEIGMAEERMAAAQQALSVGASTREAKKRQTEKKYHVEKYLELEKHAASYRNAAFAVEDVLSGLVDCPELRVSHGRLIVVGHPRGEGVPFHDLSQGERYRIVIQMAAKKVGKGGVIPLEQEGWESLDCFVRAEIHEEAESQGVYVLAPEATPRATMGRSLQAVPYVPE